MQLTLYTDYSLRVLLYLGVRREQTVTIGEIADAYRISAIIWSRWCITSPALVSSIPRAAKVAACV